MDDAELSQAKRPGAASGTLYSSLRTRLLNPVELLRETMAIVRRRRRPLLLIALTLIATQWVTERIEPHLLRQLIAGQRVSVSYGFGIRILMSVVFQWWAWLSWSAIGLVTLMDARGGTPRAGACLRLALEPGWQWLPLALAWSLAMALLTFCLVTLPELVAANSIPWEELLRARQIGFVSLRPGELVSWINAVIEKGLSLPALYVLFVPLALVLERTRAVASVRTCWRRVHGNWRWLSVGSIVLWLGSIIVMLLMRPLRGNSATPYVGVVVWSTVALVLSAARALQYVNLMARSGEDFGPEEVLLEENPGPHPVDDRRDVAGRRMGPVEGLRVEPRVLDVVVRERVDDHA